MPGIYSQVQFISMQITLRKPNMCRSFIAMVYISSLPEETGCLQYFVQLLKYAVESCIQCACIALPVLQLQIGFRKV